MKLALRIVAIAAVAMALNLTGAGRAFAVWCSADAVMVYQNMVTQFMPFLTNLVTGVGLSIETAVIQSGGAVRAEVLKSTIVNKNVAEGIEAYNQQQELQMRAQDLKEAMQQPATSCQALATSSSFRAADIATQASVFSGQSQLMSRVAVAANTNTLRTMESAYSITGAKFCSAEEKALGVCNTNTSGAYRNLAGADHDALFLFQSAAGSSSFEGDGGAQSEATDSYIARAVGGAPPTALPQQGEEFYRRFPQARAYAELSRRYDAMMSMPSYALRQIKEVHRTRRGLGTDTMLATINVAGFEPNKSDMSMAEAVERFVATKFSPQTVKDLAKATNSNVILRDMAQMNAFQLWMSYQAMQQGSRTEALMAHQLVLVADQTLRPQLEAQRAAAARSNATTR